MKRKVSRPQGVKLPEPVCYTFDLLPHYQFGKISEFSICEDDYLSQQEIHHHDQNTKCSEERSRVKKRSGRIKTIKIEDYRRF